MITREKMQALVKVERETLRTARTLLITDRWIGDADNAFFDGPRVFAQMDDGSSIELTMITNIEWSIDVKTAPRAKAVVTFVNVLIDVAADEIATMPLTPTPVEPNGTTTGIGCSSNECDGDGLHCEPVSMPTYPDNPNAKTLRLLRNANRLSLEQARERVGLTALQFSSLERGQLALPDEQWKWVHGQVARSGER